MRLIQFIKWWWERNDYFNRTLASYVIFWGIPSLISSAIIGQAGIVVGVCGALLVAIGWALYGIFYWLKCHWEQFNDEQPSEDIAILRKLKGISTPSHHEDDSN